jgi:hypothetical protein
MGPIMKLGATADKEVVVAACVLMCCCCCGGAKALTPELLELKASKRAMDETRILNVECFEKDLGCCRDAIEQKDRDEPKM